MWQAPSQRVRAIAAEKKRQRERQRRPLHIKRVQAEIREVTAPGTEPRTATARVLLNDLSPRGMGLFCGTAMLVGQEVAVTLEEPKRVYLRGRVIWCQEYDLESHVISKNAFSFRMGIKFIFQSAEEEETVKAFCEELIRTLIQPSSAA